jgi:ribose transport system ATP-binding protein
MSVSLSARNIVKRYGGVIALSDANLDVHSGETVALVGANGSGKSTLAKIINGVVVLDGGQLLLVFQELSLVPQMTVAENIWLAHEPLHPSGLVDNRRMVDSTQALLALFEDTYKSDLHADTVVLRCRRTRSKSSKF